MNTASICQALVLTNRWCLSWWCFEIVFHEVLIRSIALAWLECIFFSSSLFTVAIKSSLVIADTEECGRAAVSEFNDFGVAVSFDVVVAGYCWGRWWFVWDDTLDWKVSFGFVTSVVVGHGLYCVFSGCYLDCVLLLFCQFFWTFENCTPYFVIYLAWQLPGFLPSKSS